MGGPGAGRRPGTRRKEDATATPAQQEKIVQLFTHPRLDTIPDPDVPLREPGRKKYRELTEMLLKAGQLTVITKSFAEMAAISHDEIVLRVENSRSVSAKLMDQYNRAIANISFLDVDKPTQEAQQKNQNRFRFSGFAQRRR